MQSPLTSSMLPAPTLAPLHASIAVASHMTLQSKVSCRILSSSTLRTSNMAAMCNSLWATRPGRATTKSLSPRKLIATLEDGVPWWKLLMKPTDRWIARSPARANGGQQWIGILLFFGWLHTICISVICHVNVDCPYLENSTDCIAFVFCTMFVTESYITLITQSHTLLFSASNPARKQNQDTYSHCIFYHRTIAWTPT